MAAGGMAMLAMKSCFERDTPTSREIDGPAIDMSKVEHIGITALSEEKSLEAAQILQERHIASNPMKAYAKACSNQIVGQEEQRSRLKKVDDDRSPMVRIGMSMMPICTWLPKLDFKTVRADLIAGLTVGVMVIPQSMSYGAIAGLPYINGMYSACIPTLVYAFFGQSRQLAVGPVAMVSLLVHAGLQGQLSREDCPRWYDENLGAQGIEQYQTCPEQYVNLACMTAAVVGFMQIVASILKLGFLVSFLGHPVTSGFTSGAAIIIGLSQLKDILGYDIPKSQYVYITVYNIVKGLGKAKPLTAFLGLVFFIYLVMNKKAAQKYRSLRMLQPAGPLVSCVVGTLLLLLIPALRDEFKVKYVGYIPDGLMPLSISGFSLATVQKVLPTAMTSCLIGYMESIAIGKSLAAKHGYEVEAGQEMFALGMANLVGSAFSCYPVTGSFSRSAVNNSTGGLSQLSGVVTATVMFCTLMFLTPLFYYLPKFVLAAIVLNSVIPLVAIGEAKNLWRVKRHDFLLWVVAFVGTLFLGVLMGILVAVSLSLVIVIYESVRPQLTILWRIPGTTIYRNVKQESSGVFVPNVFICRIGSSLYFANASFVKDMLLTYVSDLEDVNPTEYLVLEMTPVITIDSTACHVFHDIVADFRSRGIEVAFAMTGNRVEKTMHKAGLKRMIGDQWFFATVNDAVLFCLRHQHAKHKRSERETHEEAGESSPTDLMQDLNRIDVGFRDEVGFSNDLHSEHTIIFITLAQDVPMIMSEITAVFKRNRLTIARAEVEPMLDDGAKHMYYLTSMKSGGKLTDVEIERVREELDAVIKTQQGPGGSPKAYPTTSSDASARIAALEEKMQAMLDAQAALMSSVGGDIENQRAGKMSACGSLTEWLGSGKRPSATRRDRHSAKE
mmetsp:Transcript_5741/g.16637  ORF Transcript_5741/g.16637 Transcript_5741/m.16637 type:complete len:895 (+) Transcript_5741:79-2763(+)